MLNTPNDGTESCKITTFFGLLHNTECRFEEDEVIRCDYFFFFDSEVVDFPPPLMGPNGNVLPKTVPPA